MLKHRRVEWLIDWNVDPIVTITPAKDPAPNQASGVVNFDARVEIPGIAVLDLPSMMMYPGIGGLTVQFYEDLQGYFSGYGIWFEYLTAREFEFKREWLAPEIMATAKKKG